MSCGWCAASTLTIADGALGSSGALCGEHWDQLVRLLERCEGMDADLADAVARPRRTGERVGGRSSTVPLPISLGAVDARRELGAALNDAVRELLGGLPALTVDGAAGLLLAHRARLRASWVAAVLLGDLIPAVPRAVTAVDLPRSRVELRVPCPGCGGGPLRPVGGVLECRGCGVRSSLGDLRAAI